MAAAAAGQQQRGPVPEQTAPAAGTNGGYYALVIGINRYPSSDMPALYTAERDADALAAVLGQSYGFQVQELTGAKATRANILGALTGYRKMLKEEDSLLIYFAGHGTRDVDVSYWLPYDADMSSNANWVSASDITSGMKGQPARHVLVISDSCYSGGLSRDVKLGLRPADRAAYLSKMLTGRSRTLMESGGLEPVSDGTPNGHSVFADAILDALKRPEIDVISAEDLFYGYVKERVAGSSKQTPEYDVIYDSGHREGDFVFVKKGILVGYGDGRPSLANDAKEASGPALDVTMKFIEDTLNTTSEVSYTETIRRSQNVVEEAPYRVAWGLSSVVTDLTACTVRYHRTYTRDGQIEMNRDVTLDLRDLDAATVKSVDRWERDIAGPKLGDSTYKIVPMTFAVDLSKGKSSKNTLFFPNEDLANRFAKAIQHAIQLCTASPF